MQQHDETLGDSYVVVTVGYEGFERIDYPLDSQKKQQIVEVKG